MAIYMLRFFEDNIGNRYMIFTYTDNLTMEILKYKLKNALKIIFLNPPLEDINCSNWQKLFTLLETILADDSISFSWNKKEFQIDFVTLTLEAIVLYQEKLKKNN